MVIAFPWAHEGQASPQYRRASQRSCLFFAGRLIDDPVVRAALIAWVNAQLVKKRASGRAVIVFYVRHFIEHVAKEYGARLAQARRGRRSLNTTQGICYKTARSWLIDLGFWVCRKSGTYYNDGHERDDVKMERGTYVKYWKENQDRMVKNHGVEVNLLLRSPRDTVFTAAQQHTMGCILRILPSGAQERPLVVGTHDESAFDCADFHTHQMWAPHGCRPEGFRGKRGETMMVTGWLFLHLGLFFYELFCVKEEGHYFNNDDMMKHTRR
jgi:hypothetical protein